jgi:uncharacterized protein YaeQ
MAMTPTIYKFSIDLSDIDRNRYVSLDLVVAKHPSETVERMLVRVLAFCINADDQLEFGKGLSDPDEPDLWLRSLDGVVNTWIDVGEPKIERIVKASRTAQDVKVYSFNSKSRIWWSGVSERCHELGVQVCALDWSSIQNAASLIDRTMQMSVTISDRSAFLATERGQTEISWAEL